MWSCPPCLGQISHRSWKSLRMGHKHSRADPRCQIPHSSACSSNLGLIECMQRRCHSSIIHSAVKQRSSRKGRRTSKVCVVGLVVQFYDLFNQGMSPLQDRHGAMLCELRSDICAVCLPDLHHMHQSSCINRITRPIWQPCSAITNIPRVDTGGLTASAKEASMSSSAKPSIRRCSMGRYWQALLTVPSNICHATAMALFRAKISHLLVAYNSSLCYPGRHYLCSAAHPLSEGQV